MKHGFGSILRPEQEAYLGRLLPPRDPLLREMEEQAAREDIPISDPEVARLLSILARATGARLMLEIGTAIGYVTLCLARAVPQARVVSIDNDPRRLASARAYLERAAVAGRVELVEGAALEVLPRLEGPFDLVYVDAVKTEYRRYLDLVLPHLRVGGLVVVDNLLWGGEVAEPPAVAAGEKEEPQAAALRAFNGYLMMHPQLESVVIPLGDGVGLATKIKALRSEMGGPF
ncbi:MAG TPA: O-methyltransferase [Thermoanaerobaculia bacterium]|nr:O-methyltransferase [Thermoanaerobaculia bacterium]